MDFLDLALKRFSVRAYESAPVADDTLGKVLEAGRMAPSAANRQPFHLVVLRDGPLRQAINTAYPREWFRKLPVVIVVCVEPSKSWVRSDGKHYGDVDAAIAMDHMTLCAASLGLGTCWVGAFDAVRVREILGLPDGIEPLAMTPLGLPAEAARAKLRKTPEELVHWERW